MPHEAAVRRLSSYEKAALGRAPEKAGAEMKFPESWGPVHLDTLTFQYQSYFDSVLLQNAIHLQPPSEPIVPAFPGGLPNGLSARTARSTSGYGVALHPDSETPVAISFNAGPQGGQSAPTILKPGEYLRPFGKPGEKPDAFSGYTWGLPFGWLGGGIATLLVFSSPDAEVRFSSSPQEMIFHRQRIKVAQPANLTTVVGAGNLSIAPFNWPLRFPWTQAVASSALVAQPGKGLIEVTPTRILMVLRGLNHLTGGAPMRIIHQATRDYGLDLNDAVVLGNPSFEDVNWPDFASIGTSGNLATQNPVIELDITHPTTRVAADDGGVVFVDNSGSAALNGTFVDVVRYGVL